MRFKTSLLATILVMAFLPALANIQSANAATCKNSNKLKSGASIGSQVNGNIVTICLSKALVLKLTKTIQPSAKPRVTVKPIPIAKPKKPTHIVKVIAKPAKPQPKPRFKSKVVSKSHGSTGTFEPSISNPQVSPVVTKPKVLVAYTTTQVVHFGRATLLGSRVVVRFTPIGLTWTFGDGDELQVDNRRSNTTHGYAADGTYTVRLHVREQVDYRLASGQWYRDPDTIVLLAKPIKVLVGAAARTASGGVSLMTP